MSQEKVGIQLAAHANYLSRGTVFSNGKLDA